MSRSKLTEVDLCRMAKDWLLSHSLDVYQEVQFYHGGPRADLVATNSSTLTILKAKLAPSLRLLGQACAWTRMANLIWVATLWRPSSKIKVDHASRRAFEAFLSDRGIGWVEFLDDSHHQILAQAKLKRGMMAAELRSKLVPEMKCTVDAGGNRGGYWTPYRDTCDTIREFVGKNPGCNLRAAIAELGKMHYSSIATAKSSLREMLKRGLIHGVRLGQDGKTLEIET